MSYSRSWAVRMQDAYVEGVNYKNGNFHSKTGSPLPTYSLLMTGTRSGTRVDSFSQKIKNHTDASSDYSIASAKEGRKKLSWTTGYGKVSSDNYTTYLWYQHKCSPPVPVNNSIDARAKEKFYKNLSNVRRSIHFLENVGEFKEVKEMFRDRARILYLVVYRDKRQLEKEYRVGRYVRHLPFARNAKMLSSIWLQMQFGWKPLIADLQSVKEDLQTVHNGLFRTIRGSHADNRIGDLARTTSGFQYAQITTTSCTQYLSRTKYAAGLWYTEPWTERWGLSLDNIFGAVWELTPWSFLVDYFTDVSTFITSLQEVNTKYVYCTRSVTLRSQVRAVSVPTKAAGAYHFVGESGYCDSQRFSHVRTKIETPGLYLPPLHLADALSLPREMNVLALGIQRIFKY